MFEKFMEKFSKRETEKEEMEFKPFEQAQRAELPAQPKEIEAPVQQKEARSSSVELKVIRPESFEEAAVVADNLIAGCTVVLNIEILDKPTCRKMLDFLNGVTYCLDGEIKQVAPSTFIITPHSDVDISDM